MAPVERGRCAAPRGLLLPIPREGSPRRRGNTSTSVPAPRPAPRPGPFLWARTSAVTLRRFLEEAPDVLDDPARLKVVAPEIARALEGNRDVRQHASRPARHDDHPVRQPYGFVDVVGHEKHGTPVGGPDA